MTERIVLEVSARAEEPPPVPCPYCAREARRVEEGRMFDGSLLRCECGATGLMCSPADLDEASEQMFGVLGMHGVSFSEPAVPVGTSGRLMLQHYDSPKLLGRLTGFFEDRGHRVTLQEAELVIVFPDGREPVRHLEWLFWFRPAATS